MAGAPSNEYSKIHQSIFLAKPAELDARLASVDDIADLLDPNVTTNFLIKGMRVYVINEESFFEVKDFGAGLVWQRELPIVFRSVFTHMPALPGHVGPTFGLRFEKSAAGAGVIGDDTEIMNAYNSDASLTSAVTFRLNPGIYSIKGDIFLQSDKLPELAFKLYSNVPPGTFATPLPGTPTVLTSSVFQIGGGSMLQNRFSVSTMVNVQRSLASQLFYSFGLTTTSSFTNTTMVPALAGEDAGITGSLEIIKLGEFYS
jgi:hypothetical protein